MPLESIKSLIKKSYEEDYVEFPSEGISEEETKIQVRVASLNSIVDVERVAKYVREGNILFLKTKELQKTDLGQFQAAVQRLKRICTQFGWEIVGTEEGYLIVTPQFATIVR